MSTTCPGMLDDGYWSAFSADFADYELGGPIGFGASSTVYSASFQPTLTSASPTTSSPSSGSSRKPSLSITIPAANPGTGSKVASGAERECAIKVSSSHPDVGQLFRESRLLGLSRHTNVLRVLATFTLPPDHRRIAIVTPLIQGGSLAGILDWRSRMATSPRSNGRLPKFRLGRKQVDEDEESIGRLDEEEIKTATKQVLDGLVYLHGNGFLHRDLKAGNILISHDGTILLADFGVAGDINAALTPAIKPLPLAEELHYRQTNGTAGGIAKDLPTRAVDMSEDVGKRKSFVGTPSWMAPEIVLGQRYDAKADIWSLGITLLELAHGSAPRSNEKANNILRSTALDAAPTLDRSVGAFSKSMKDFIDLCLQKVPEDRPTAAQLQEHQWLRGAKKGSFLAETLLTSAEVPALETRQEIRRVPTMSTLHSRASSWDFSASPSVTTSPVRMTFGATPGAPPLPLPDHIPSTSRAQSRSSSRIPSLPPSPRIPLRQWAERTASEHSDDWKRRSTSDSPYLPRMGSRTMRKASTLSFDEETKGDPLVKPSSSRRTPSAEGTMSPVVEAQALASAPPQIELDVQVEGLMLDTNDETRFERQSVALGRSAGPDPRGRLEGHVQSRGAPVDGLGFTSSPDANAIDLTKDAGEPPDIRRGRSGTFIAPAPTQPPPIPELQRSDTFKGTIPEKEKDKEKKGWLGRKVSLKTDGLARRLTGKKK